MDEVWEPLRKKLQDVAAANRIPKKCVGDWLVGAMLVELKRRGYEPYIQLTAKRGRALKEVGGILERHPEFSLPFVETRGGSRRKRR